MESLYVIHLIAEDIKGIEEKKGGGGGGGVWW